MPLPKFKTKEELFKHLADNFEDIVFEKKASKKLADSVPGVILMNDQFSGASKSSVDSSRTEIKVRAIISTTMVKDSHGDVHIDGCFKKSIKENKRIKHIREHKSGFENIIADKDDLKISVKRYKWRDLGEDADGETEALVFDSIVKQSRNPFMFDQYSKGHVDNHSIGMYYGDIFLALDSGLEEHKEFKANFDRYIDKILNKKQVKSDGWFYGVPQLKVIEGSAVTDGSNIFTPTLDIKNKEVDLSSDDIKKQAIQKWLMG